MVTNVIRIKVVHETEGTVINGETQNTHVVCVEHTVTEAVNLPEGSELGSSISDFLEE